MRVVPLGVSDAPRRNPEFVLCSYDTDFADALYWAVGVGWVQDINQASVGDATTILMLSVEMAKPTDQDHSLYKAAAKRYIQPRPVVTYR